MPGSIGDVSRQPGRRSRAGEDEIIENTYVENRYEKDSVYLRSHGNPAWSATLAFGPGSPARHQPRHPGLYYQGRGYALGHIGRDLSGSEIVADYLGAQPPDQRPQCLRPGQQLILGETNVPETKREEARADYSHDAGGDSHVPADLPPVALGPTVGTDEKFVMEALRCLLYPQGAQRGVHHREGAGGLGQLSITPGRTKRLLTDDNIVFVKLPKKRLVTMKRGDRFYHLQGGSEESNTRSPIVRWGMRSPSSASLR